MDEKTIDIEEIMNEIRARAKEIEYQSPVTFKEILIPRSVNNNEELSMRIKFRNKVKAIAYKISDPETVHEIRKELVKKSSGR